MKNQFKIIIVLFQILLSVSCSSENPITNPNSIAVTQTKEINYLALGDSYTIGQSVCETCRFPEQLKKKLNNLNQNNSFSLQIIAQTGWTTTNLISAIDSQSLSPKYDLVTLLIGVNNQYQQKTFSLYQKEFPELLTKAISLAKGDETNVIVVSIPDYAYTPFGQQTGNPSTISFEINVYNAFAKKYCAENNIAFINITDITSQGLINTNLVAPDGLHPSESAYSLFVEHILPKATAAIQN